MEAAGGLGNYKSAGLDVLGIALLNETEVTWAKVERAVPPFTMGNFVRAHAFAPCRAVPGRVCLP